MGQCNVPRISVLLNGEKIFLGTMSSFCVIIFQINFAGPVVDKRFFYLKLRLHRPTKGLSAGIMSFSYNLMPFGGEFRLCNATILCGKLFCIVIVYSTPTQEKCTYGSSGVRNKFPFYIVFILNTKNLLSLLVYYFKYTEILFSSLLS